MGWWGRRPGPASSLWGDEMPAQMVHLVLGLAAIIAAVVLAATKSIAGSDAIVLISAVSGVMLGSSSVKMGNGAS